MGVSEFLKEVVRIDVAKELTMVATILSGEEAEKLGLVKHACSKSHPRCLKLCQAAPGEIT
jgi:enoyl-CoA hydratase/carnithine racemase